MLNEETVKAVDQDVLHVYTLFDGNSTQTKPSEAIEQINRPKKHGIYKILAYFSAKSNQPNNKEKMKEEIVSGIVNCIEYVQEYMNPTVDTVIEITNNIARKYSRCNKELEYAHVFAKTLATKILQQKQLDWEMANSITAKLLQLSTKEEMRAYFDSVSKGIVATELLVTTIDANLKNILPEAFKKEIIRIIDLRVRTKHWLSNPMAMQSQLDLALFKLVSDEGKVDDVLEKIRRPAKFYEQVLLNLIANEIPDMNKEFESFNGKLKYAINSALSEAVSVERGKAKEFINELHRQCSKLFIDNYLTMNLVTDSDGYEGCDNEEKSFFREKCLQLVEKSLLKSRDLWYGEWKIELSRQVLAYMRDVRRDDVARPRCKAPASPR